MKGLLLVLIGSLALASSATIKIANATQICAAIGSDSILVEHEECDKFYKCFRGEPVAIPCPTNPVLYYNDKIKACDWPENVDCGERTVPERFDNQEAPKEIEIPKTQGVNADPAEAPEICAADNSDGILVAHEDCTKFYICSNGAPVKSQCGKSPVLYYNPELNACDWPENVDCGDRSVPDNADNEKAAEICTADSTGDKLICANSGKGQIERDESVSYEDAAIEACAAEGSDNILLAHDDCDKFYECSGGKPVPFQCPVKPLLFFNPQTLLCDWADNVSCGDRNIPDSAIP